ncbi:MAG: hypothetical protein ABIF10_00665 [Candidatus Woesearchaeota archaeon]
MQGLSKWMIYLGGIAACAIAANAVIDRFGELKERRKYIGHISEYVQSHQAPGSGISINGKNQEYAVHQLPGGGSYYIHLIRDSRRNIKSLEVTIQSSTEDNRSRHIRVKTSPEFLGSTDVKKSIDFGPYKNTVFHPNYVLRVIANALSQQQT